MFQLPVVDPCIPCALVPQASRRRGALLARTLLRTGIVDAALMPLSVLLMKPFVLRCLKIMTSMALKTFW